MYASGCATIALTGSGYSIDKIDEQRKFNVAETIVVNHRYSVYNDTKAEPHHMTTDMFMVDFASYVVFLIPTNLPRLRDKHGRYLWSPIKSEQYGTDGATSCSGLFTSAILSVYATG